MNNQLCLPEDITKSLDDFNARLSKYVSDASTPSSNGRLLYVVDATASRETFWEHTQNMMNDLFSAVGEASGVLSVQLCWFLGQKTLHSKWHKDPESLKKIMRQVSCDGGMTQMAKAFGYAADESQKEKIDVVIYVGDSCEENEEDVVRRAASLSKTGSKLFLLDDKDHSTCRHANTLRIFVSTCETAGGIYTAFDKKAISDLREFFKVSAVYATGGKKAVQALPETPKTDLGRKFVQNILALK
ncbi:MAG: VWA domain-containing protein [Desulfobulbaceae bacterium]|nr:VWA domain-containing protein [Desulfobulbaceae bacterium]